MSSDIALITLIIVTLALAIFTVENSDLLHSIIAFCGLCITVGLFFWLLYAPFVALFQFMVYAGAVVALFIATIMLTTRKECEDLE